MKEKINVGSSAFLTSVNAQPEGTVAEASEPVELLVLLEQQSGPVGMRELIAMSSEPVTKVVRGIEAFKRDGLVLVNIQSDGVEIIELTPAGRQVAKYAQG